MDTNRVLGREPERHGPGSVHRYPGRRDERKRSFVLDGAPLPSEEEPERELASSRAENEGGVGERLDVVA
jgi:hypothetical protein